MAVKAPRVCIAAGGTGGHVLPGLEVARLLREHGAEVSWLGTRRGIESRLVPEQGIPLSALWISGARGRGAANWLAVPFKLCVSVVQAALALLRHRADCVLGFGGYASLPGGLAAWLLRRPLVVLEQNAVAGSANRLLAPLARRVLLGMPLEPGRHARLEGLAQLVGNPVRESVAQVEPRPPRQAGQPLRLLVLGGSRGAAALNSEVPLAIANLCVDFDGRALEPGSVLVRHQCGSEEYRAVLASYRALGLRGAVVEPFIKDMAAAYAEADIVLCRAGAMTVAELAAAGRGAILAPLPGSSDGHQQANARWFASRGAGLLLERGECDACEIAKLLQGLYADPAQCAVMGEAARALALPGAAGDLARACMEAAR